MASSLLALFAEVGLRLLEPWPLKFVFDYIIGSQPRQGQVLSALQSLDSMTLLTLAAVAVVVITGLRAGAS